MYDENRTEKSEENMFLNRPQTTKELIHGHSFAFAGMQGWRKSNEDFHKHFIPFDHQSWKLWSLFAIFDGHNGIDTAKNAADLLGQYLLDALNPMRENSSNESIDSSEYDRNQLTSIIQNTFLQLDKNLSELVHDHSGSVCIASLIGPEYVYLINVGDSRAIIISNDGKVLASTKDHKANVRKEQERIRKAGGRITQYGDDVARVEDQLAVSRALGDYSFNKKLIPAIPDIIHYSKQTSAAFVILACDGIWDVMTNEQVASFVSKRIAHNSLENIASQLVDHCLKLDTTDNISVYIVKL